MEYKIIPNKKDSFSDRIKNAIENIENDIIDIQEKENILIDIIENRFLYIKN